MNVVHAFIFFSIRFAGGTSDLMFKLAKAQVKHGLKPIIYSGNYKFDYDLAKSLEDTKFRVCKSWFDKLGFSIMPKLKNLLQEDLQKIDIVHMHVFRTYQNIILYYFCIKNNIPYIMDAHGAVPYYKNKNLLKKLFDKIWGKSILNKASYLIAETQVGVNEYLSLFPKLNKDRIVIISPPFDTDEFDILPPKGSFRKKYNISLDKKLIMFLGRVHHIKGNDFLIDAFHKLCQQRDDCILAIVGSDDGHMDDCKKQVEVLKLNNKVIFTGFIGGSDKNSALVDADIVAQMSRQEQGAWAPFEAVLCETPIIVTEDTGAGEDVKRVDAGETVLFGDVNSLSGKLNDILENYDNAISKTLSAKQYIVTKMSMNARVHEYTDLYKMAIRECVI